MRARTTVLLALALMVASIVAWLDTPTGPATQFDPLAEVGESGRPGPDDIVRLMHFSSADVTRVTLQRGALNTTLTRTAHGWDGISEPAAVEDFLRSMQELAQIIVVGADEGGPKDYGLDPPVARVTMERAGDSPIDLRIGSANPSSTGIYAQVGPDGPVVLTGALVLWDFDKLARIIQSTHTPAAG